MSEKKKKSFFNTIEEKKNYNCTFYPEVWGEIKRVENESFEIEGKEYRRLRLVMDGKNDERFYLLDKNVEHQKIYERGLKGVFKIRVDVDEGFHGKTKITIIGFAEE